MDIADIIIGIYALINVHKYHCIVIRMRCWLMDDYFFSNTVLIVHIRVSRKLRTLCT